jgi:regulator of replication initiation timing
MNPDPISAALDALHNQNLLAAENARLKAEVEALRKELADAQESYHLCNERIASLLRQQSRE